MEQTKLLYLYIEDSYFYQKPQSVEKNTDDESRVIIIDMDILQNEDKLSSQIW
jgi:hypothetical protein